MRLPRLEPGIGYLFHLRDQGDLGALAAYLEDPGATRRQRRKAVAAIATMAPGGGSAGPCRGRVDAAVIPFLGPLIGSDPDPAVRRRAAFGLRRTEDPGAVPYLLEAAADSDRATRRHAARGLRELGWRESVQPVD